MKRIIEAGHFYLAKGTTIWSSIGWDILKQQITKEDVSLLFVDDVHDISDVGKVEVELPLVPINWVEPDYLIWESSVESLAYEFLAMLQGDQIKKKKRARQNGDNKWYCSGAALTTTDGTPLCLLLDAGLTLHKFRLGFTNGLNILPHFYEAEQINLLRLVKKALPQFTLKVILYDLDGNQWKLTA